MTSFRICQYLTDLPKICLGGAVDILTSLLIGIVVVVLFLYWSRTRFNAYNHATNICKVMLISYFGLQSKYPETPKEELYLNALLLRPTIDSETAKYILEERKGRLNDPSKFKFWMVVLKMIEYEFAENNDMMALGAEKRLNFFKQFKNAVTANIPTNI